MTDTLRSLARIESSYPYFERDQVLTPAHLNGLAEYLDDQERVTRAALVGVGIACGLWATGERGRVRLSHGVGVTTDGDAVSFPVETLYDRFKPYDRTAPVYPPFGQGADMIVAYELVRAGVQDERAMPLDEFASRADRPLESMYAVLYVESFLRDPDLCTGTDCDNLGQQTCNTLRLLLVERGSAERLATGFDTPDSAARRPLPPVAAARAIVRGAVNSEATLAAIYRRACASTLADLLRAFATVYPACQAFLQDVTRDDPAPRWRRRLEEVAAAAEQTDRGVQYYYDFLKDLVDTYNAFRDALYGDTAVCSPDPNAFPKHLVLGALDPALRSPRERTGFYPSPMVSGAYEQRAGALFLLRRLDVLIARFVFPAPARGIRITPSAFEDRALDKRAIPFYYDAPAVVGAWSYELSRRGMERRNYSYNADLYGAEGPAAAPLQWQLGAYDFFRVEGHVGLERDAALAALRGIIDAQNLPIDVEYVRLDKPPKGWRPPWRFPELFRFHHLMRAEVSTQLAEATRFGDLFADRIKAATASNVITKADNNDTPPDAMAEDKKRVMAVPMRAAAQKIDAPAYDRTWKVDFKDAVEGAAEFQQAFTAVTKKEFASPIDQLITGQPARWLDWLDVLIDDVEDKEADRARLSQFAAEHPGVEHFGGVLRGGTFVLVCDAQNVVVADLMLPYSTPEQRVEPPRPPKLLPPLRPDIVFEKPIRLVPFPDKFRFEKFKDDVVNGLQKDFDVQKKYFDGFKDSLNLFAGPRPGTGGAAPLPGGGRPPGGAFVPGAEVTNPVLNMHLTDTSWKTHKVDLIRTELLNPQLEEAQRTTLEAQLKTAETELASAIVAATDYMAGASVPVTPGTEGAAVVTAAASSLTRVSDIDALANVERGLTAVSGRANTAPELRTVIGSMLGGRIR